MRTALYRHFDAEGRLLYVGISLRYTDRTRSHRINAGWFDQIATITIEWFLSRVQAETAEYQAIRNERPIHNKQHNRRPAYSGTQINVINEHREIILEPVSVDVLTAKARTGDPLAKQQLKLIREANVRARMGMISSSPQAK